MCLWLTAPLGAGINGTIRNFHGGLDIKPMTPEHFDIAIAAISFKRADILKACRAVFVDGKPLSDIVDKFDIPQPQI